MSKNFYGTQKNNIIGFLNYVHGSSKVFCALLPDMKALVVCGRLFNEQLGTCGLIVFQLAAPSGHLTKNKTGCAGTLP